MRQGSPRKSPALFFARELQQRARPDAQTKTIQKK
jgi:hypothetical protein